MEAKYNQQQDRKRDDNERLDFTSFDWYSVLPQFGVDPRYLTKKHGPCPLCAINGAGGKAGTNKDRFRFDNKFLMGNYWCQTCGPGNAWNLMLACSGLPESEIMDRLRKIKGFQPVDSVARPVAPVRVDAELTEKEVAQNRKRLKQAESGARAIKPGDPVWQYLSKRVPGGDLRRLSPYIRFNPSMEFYEDEVVKVGPDRYDTKSVCRGRFPVMLAKVIDSERKGVTMHRTYLTPQGEKAPFEMVKKQMAGIRKLKGEAIPVCETPGSRVLGVCEGIETAWAVATAYRYSINVWALLNCVNLSVADIPDGKFDKVIIFADHDKIDPVTGHRPGEHRAAMLKEKLEARGIACEIRKPPKEGTDFADEWMAFYLARKATRPYIEQQAKGSDADRRQEQSSRPASAAPPIAENPRRSYPAPNSARETHSRYR
ncbi:DUF7146 domain-containing protein [Noviherbaspirillum pedocola]|uniref:Toprim domain-containing protein n=1 Tax=Noviherbaspirillum pedocola TaxID=2801341 RepID=A0A934SVP9_9BURK|nr:toprim domain-containing protein [Noviherbaspirillum pedocola]MBK4736011.1 toprim domain-containing protein [Noviherbaspirillum pedocola]